MSLVLLLLAIILIGYDWRYRSVPTIPFILFCIGVVAQGWPSPQWRSFGIGCVLIVLCIGTEYFFKRPLLGIADKVLLPISLLLIPLLDIGFYFICVGIIGLLISLFWRRVYGLEYFPFLPALIIPLLGIILKCIDFST